MATERLNVVYDGTHAVDVYRTDSSEALPVVVLVGAPGFHRFEANVRLARALCSRGVAALIPEFQLASLAAGFGRLQNHLTANATGLGIDLSKIVILGVSSGAPLGAVWAFDDDALIRVRGYVGAGGLYGALIWPLIGGNASLVIRLVHGEDDESAPLTAAQATVHGLSEAGYDANLLTAPGSHQDTFDPTHDLGQTTVTTVLEMTL